MVLKHTGNDTWKGVICDATTGQEIEVEFTGTEVSAIFALTLHNDGMPVAVEAQYAIAEPAMQRYGMEDKGANVKLRPIP